MSKLKKTDKMDSGITIVLNFDPSGNGKIEAFGCSSIWSEISDVKPYYDYQRLAGTTTHTDYQKALAAVKRAFWTWYGVAGCVRMYRKKNAEEWTFDIIVRKPRREDLLPGAVPVTADEFAAVARGADAFMDRLIREGWPGEHRDEVRK
ncbi:hypothetical protein [Methanofollis tationis]|uniref:Uncharacterized protein n=1 Tax=Methanofollis tationis TaxID=81417 RepID=A0A7K4HMA8_9EURY|nr:hypothetical protein [Methanofollis tationis]NVO66405.1 hypothetical protein [Methanofollis tationis]